MLDAIIYTTLTTIAVAAGITLAVICGTLYDRLTN